MADWEAKGKLFEKYPERAELDAWVASQCQKTKDAALLVRYFPRFKDAGTLFYFRGSLFERGEVYSLLDF